MLAYDKRGIGESIASTPASRRPRARSTCSPVTPPRRHAISRSSPVSIRGASGRGHSQAGWIAPLAASGSRDPLPGPVLRAGGHGRRDRPVPDARGRGPAPAKLSDAQIDAESRGRPRAASIRCRGCAGCASRRCGCTANGTGRCRPALDRAARARSPAGASRSPSSRGRITRSSRRDRTDQRDAALRHVRAGAVRPSRRVAAGPRTIRRVIDHVGVNVRDYAISRRCYEQALAPLGYGVRARVRRVRGRRLRPGQKPVFWVGQREPLGTGTHVAFTAPTARRSDASTTRRSPPEASTTASPACASTTTRPITAPSCSTPTATTSRPSATSPSKTGGEAGPLDWADGPASTVFAAGSGGLRASSASRRRPR